MTKPGDVRGGNWLSFQLAAVEVERQLGLSWGAAQKTLIDACKNGQLRTQRHYGTGPDVLDIDLTPWLQQLAKPKTKTRGAPKDALAREIITKLNLPANLTTKEVYRAIADHLGKGRSIPSLTTVKRVWSKRSMD